MTHLGANLRIYHNRGTPEQFGITGNYDEFRISSAMFASRGKSKVSAINSYCVRHEYADRRSFRFRPYAEALPSGIPGRVQPSAAVV